MVLEIIDFDIKVETEIGFEKISFRINYDDYGIDYFSFNPICGWTNYNDWNRGWSEQNEDLNELCRAIKDYSNSMECDELVSDFSEEDIGKTFEVLYFCDGYVNINKEYLFEVTCTDVYSKNE